VTVVVGLELALGELPDLAARAHKGKNASANGISKPMDCERDKEVGGRDRRNQRSW
jgi:hypothetical protein